MENSKIYGILLAAGFSGRMGKFKPLLNYKGKSFVRTITEKLLAVCDEVIIVTGFNSEQIEKELKENSGRETISKVNFVFNENYRTGMFTSLKKGIQNCRGTGWVLYHFIDQPTLPFGFYEEFIKQIEDGYDWIQPAKEGKNGHPVLFGKKVIEKIEAAPDDSSLREITRAGITKKYWECGYSQIFDDLDDIEDYNKIIC